jgi:formylglycine-generating enzyme required for sulfatase activity
MIRQSSRYSRPAGATVANLADLTLKRANGESDRRISWSDGYVSHAPTDALLRPNPFGLHGVIGNVREWCRDHFGTRSYRMRRHLGNGLREPADRRWRVVRGSSYLSGLWPGRSASRHRIAADVVQQDLGVRPARPLD